MTWLPAQVAAIIAAAVIAQRQADQDVDEADMSLAYSGGSGRVSLLWHCPSCILQTEVLSEGMPPLVASSQPPV